MIPSSSRIGARTRSAASAAGAVSDEQFRAAFEAVPDIRIESLKDMIAETQKQTAILENLTNDWTKRIKALQCLRSIVVHDIGCYHAYAEQTFALLGTALLLSVKDLRSQVCREACITIAYFCEKLGTGYWRVAESVLPVTMNLAQNSAKVMATSGQICNVYITKNIQHPKLLSIIVQHVSSKAKEIRRMTILLVSSMITVWDPANLDKHWPELTQCIKLALSDADSETRANARQCFEALQSTYPAKADALFHQLEPSKQRILAGRSSTASSTHSINSERDNLPNPNRGLYNAQNSFLNKRSASDLNHTVRRLNLAVPKIIHRPNVVRQQIGKPPQATPLVHKPQPMTPSNKKMGPAVPASANKLQKSVSTTAYAKSTSQPGSRSTSPSRKARTIQAPTPGKKLTNGREHHEMTHTPVKPATHGEPAHKEFVRALTRNVRPNVIRTTDEHHHRMSPGGLSPMQLNFSTRSNDSPSNDFYGLSQKQEAALHRINSEEYSSSSAGIRRKSSTNNSADSKHLSTEGIENGQNKWSYLSADVLAIDTEKQANFIQEICDIIGSSTAINDKDVEDALHVLTRMVREDGITLWNEFFNTIFFAIQQIISRESDRCYNSIRIAALKGLKEVCLAQPKRLVSKTEILLVSILNAHECDDATVVRAAEDCGAAIATHLPTNTCMNLLLTVIDDRNSKYHQLSGAIKMLSNVVSKLPEKEVEGLLGAIVPRMTRCYENSQSMVRRASIICLVSISYSIGLDVLKPHLNLSTLKLVEVYRERMSKRAVDGANTSS